MNARTRKLEVFRISKEDVALAAAKGANAALADAGAVPVPVPEIFPGEIEDFLKLVVKAKTLADGRRRLIDFLSCDFSRNYEPLPVDVPKRLNGETPTEFRERCEELSRRRARDMAALAKLGRAKINREVATLVKKRLARFERDGIDCLVWRSMAVAYVAWWKRHVADTRRASGRASARKRSQLGTE